MDNRLKQGTLIERHGEWSFWADAVFAQDDHGNVKPAWIILNPTERGGIGWGQKEAKARAHWAEIKAKHP